MFDHTTVLLKELVDHVAGESPMLLIDCTAGGGGHTAALVQRIQKGGRVIAFDRDDQAQLVLKQRFAAPLAEGSLLLVHSAFSHLASFLKQEDLFGKVDGIIADLGVSSPQLERGERGFSFHLDGPLDMRMDQTHSLTAADVVNGYADSDLARIFFQYGEEPKGNVLARAICKRRLEKAFTTTLDLAEFIRKNLHYKEKSKKHPATKVFQALRIEVNDELKEVATLAQAGFEALKPGGRLGIISFHSLEDKIVKKTFKDYAEPKDPFSRHLPIRADENLINKRGILIKPFPIYPTDDEIANNNRARSAKLRIIEKIT